MTRPEYRRIATSNATQAYTDFASQYGLTTIGAVAGGIIGTPFMGSLIGSGVGALGDLAFGVVASRAMEGESMGVGIRSIAEQNFGRISRGQARRMTDRIQDYAYSPEGRAARVDIERLQENILGFDAAGGFSNVTSAEEMEEVLDGVIRNTRSFANAFKVKQEEAVQIMAELQRSMVATTDQMGVFSGEMDYLGGVTGMGAIGITQFGMQGVQMLSDTGISPTQRFNMAINARTQAEMLRFADPTTRQLVQDRGGAEAFALSQLELSNRFMMSGQGMMSMAGMLGGGHYTDSLTQQLTNAGSFLASDPRNILRLQANQGQLIGQLGFQESQAATVSMAYNFARASGLTEGGGEIDESAFIGVMSNMLNISPEQARGMLAGFRDTSERDLVGESQAQMLRGMDSIIEQNQVTGWDRFRGNVGAGISNIFRSVGAEYLYDNAVSAAGRF